MSWDLERCRKTTGLLVGADAVMKTQGPKVFKDFLIMDTIPKDYTEEQYRIEIATRYCIVYDSLPIHILGNTAYYKLANLPYNLPKYYEENHVVLGIECDEQGLPRIVKWEDQGNMNKIVKTDIFSGSGIIAKMARHAKHTNTTFGQQLERLQEHLKKSDTQKLFKSAPNLFLLGEKIPTLQDEDFKIGDDNQPKDEHKKASDEVRYTFTSLDTLELLIKNSTKAQLMHNMEAYRS